MPRDKEIAPNSFASMDAELHTEAPPLGSLEVSTLPLWSTAAQNDAKGQEIEIRKFASLDGGAPRGRATTRVVGGEYVAVAGQPRHRTTPRDRKSRSTHSRQWTRSSTRTRHHSGRWTCTRRRGSQSRTERRRGTVNLAPKLIRVNGRGTPHRTRHHSGRWRLVRCRSGQPRQITTPRDRK